MIDLHMHTRYSSDSVETVSELLSNAQAIGLDIISITDHNSVDAYKELENPDVRKIFDGEIISGVELVAMLDGRSFEILGYGIDVKKMGAILKKHGQENKDYFTALRNGIYKKLDELGLGVERKNFATLPEWNQYIYESRGKDLLKYEQFTIRKELFRKFLNTESVLGVDISCFYKSPQKVIAWIHECGGRAFLAHPAEYNDASNKILHAVIGMIDGIECFHPSATLAYSAELVKIAEENNLLISGGSDYHGMSRPTMSIAAQKLPTEYAGWVRK